jgi:hypothetical protein
MSKIINPGAILLRKSLLSFFNDWQALGPE